MSSDFLMARILSLLPLSGHVRWDDESVRVPLPHARLDWGFGRNQTSVKDSVIEIWGKKTDIECSSQYGDFAYENLIRSCERSHPRLLPHG